MRISGIFFYEYISTVWIWRKTNTVLSIRNRFFHGINSYVDWWATTFKVFFKRLLRIISQYKSFSSDSWKRARRPRLRPSSRMHVIYRIQHIVFNTIASPIVQNGELVAVCVCVHPNRFGDAGGKKNNNKNSDVHYYITSIPHTHRTSSRKPPVYV